MGVLTTLLWEQGRAAWPSVDLDEPSFTRHVETVVATFREPSPDRIAHLDGAGLYLACACAQGAPTAHAAFEASVLAEVPSFLRRFDGGDAFADDVRQELRERLLLPREGAAPRIASYSGEGPLGAWVRVIAVRIALDMIEKKGPIAAREPTNEPHDAVGTDSDPERALARQSQGHIIRQVLEEAVSALPSAQRKALRLHFAEGLTGEEIGVELGISRATVTRWLATAREFLERETKRLLRARLAMTDAEAGSLIAASRSHLDLSLSALLATRVRE